MQSAHCLSMPQKWAFMFFYMDLCIRNGTYRLSL